MENTLPKAMVFSLVFFNGFWAGLGPILRGVWDPFGVPWVTFCDVFEVCMSISRQKGIPERLGAGFGLIFMIFRGFWGLFFVFLGGCRGGIVFAFSRYRSRLQKILLKNVLPLLRLHENTVFLRVDFY